MTAIRSLGSAEPVRSLIKYSQFFQCSQAIEGAIPQQGDLVVAQVSVKAHTKETGDREWEVRKRPKENNIFKSKGEKKCHESELIMCLINSLWSESANKRGRAKDSCMIRSELLIVNDPTH